MSVLIKGMDMPESCVACLMCDKSNEGMWYCVATMTDLSDRLKDLWEYRPDWCPLIEVPTPHGRLVDIGKVIVREDVDYQVYRFDAPTVIEEEVMPDDAELS